MVDLADFIEHLLNPGISGQAVARLLDLGWGFEQKRLHPPFGEAAVEIKERAVLGAVRVAAAVGLATLHEALDQGGVEDFRGSSKERSKWALRWRRARVAVRLRGCSLLIAISRLPK